MLDFAGASCDDSPSDRDRHDLSRTDTDPRRTERCFMCGILCRHARRGHDPASAPARSPEELTTLLATLGHRGPDATGSLIHGEAWLGHTRLSIIDLAGGDQPLLNEDGTVAVILNGEIYNHGELREDLKARGHVFRSRSDTEVLAHLWEEYGEGMLSRLVGMFAFVVHDERQGVLFAARDRLGEKPLLYHEADGELYIASELKALSPLLGASPRIDRQALALYLNCMYVPAPLTIFEGIRKLQPGHWLRHDADGLKVHRYWEPRLTVDWSMTEAEAIAGLRKRLQVAVASQLEADVPVGIFLSGGLDSASVVVCAAAAGGNLPATYTMGMGGGLDEREWAAQVATRYRTDHHELWADRQVPDVFAQVMDHLDEPFADSSVLPTYLVAQAASRHLKVVLTGDGGDELMAGYDGYLWQATQRSSRLGGRLARQLSRLGLRAGYDRHAQNGWPLRSWLHARTIFEAEELPRWLGEDGPDTESFWTGRRWLEFTDNDPLSVAFEHDFNFYLPDDLLKKVDMASMLASLECRAPFLDHRLVEFCMRIPPTLKLHGGQTKHLLRKAMRGALPEAILQRPKQGFGSPVAHWVHGPLQETARDLLAPGCRCESWLTPGAVRGVVDAMWNGPRTENWRHAQQFWTLLTLEWWLRRYV
jgi:asparagine synthase (glutamine-hydrolysing)